MKFIPEEKNSGRHNSIPHRGRMLELPGSPCLVNGKHSFLMMPAPNGTHVSLISPTNTQIDSFIKQGIFTDDELDFCVKDEHKMASDSLLFLGCLSLVMFDGF